jgi:hypothetical protein
VSALASYALWGTGELTGLVGYRVDRSAHAVVHEKALSAADRLAASTSRYDAALLGALLSAPLGRFTGVGEISWDINVGSGAPSAFQSPLRFRAAVQTMVGKYLLPSVELGANASGHPSLASGARIEPRFWAAIGLGVVLDHAAPAPAAPPPEDSRPASAEEEPQTGEVRVRVMDAAHNPLADASISVEANGERQELTSDVTGRAQFTVPRGSKLTFSVRAEGWRPAERSVVLRKTEGELSFALERDLPEGEIKGNVRSLRGGPLKAQVEVLNTGLVVTTEDDGTFHIDVPPGDYRLRITAEGHEAQERTAQVERLGVTILVVDLRRTTK